MYFLWKLYVFALIILSFIIFENFKNFSISVEHYYCCQNSIWKWSANDEWVKGLSLTCNFFSHCSQMPLTLMICFAFSFLNAKPNVGNTLIIFGFLLSLARCSMPVQICISYSKYLLEMCGNWLLLYQWSKTFLWGLWKCLLLCTLKNL